MFLITSCPRSGTVYMETLLKNYANIKHVCLCQQGKLVEYENTYDGFVAWPYIVSDKYKFDVILHQVRNPIDTISSLTNANKQSFEYIFNYIPNPDSDSKLLKSMYTWYYWNKLIDEKTDKIYRIEDIENKFLDICNLISIDCNNIEFPKDKKINTWSHEKFTIDDLKNEDKELTEKICDLAYFYGYEL